MDSSMDDQVDGRIAHALCMVIAMGCFFPFHWLSNVFTKSSGNDSAPLELNSPAGFYVAMRNAIGVIVCTAGIVFIVQAHGDGGHDSMASAHKAVGWTIFAAVWLQVVLVGLMIISPFARTAHRWLGRASITVSLGFQLWSGAEILAGWKTAGSLIGFGVLIFTSLFLLMKADAFHATDPAKDPQRDPQSFAHVSPLVKEMSM